MTRRARRSSANRSEPSTCPQGTTIGAIVRGNDVLIAHDDVIVEPDDHVILFLIDKQQIKAVERLFQVGLTFF